MALHEDDDCIYLFGGGLQRVTCYIFGLVVHIWFCGYIVHLA